MKEFIFLKTELPFIPLERKILFKELLYNFFKENFPNYKVLKNELSEFLIFLNSGGVNSDIVISIISF